MESGASVSLACIISMFYVVSKQKFCFFYNIILLMVIKEKHGVRGLCFSFLLIELHFAVLSKRFNMVCV